MNSKPKLNIIGAGALGKTLARCFVDHRCANIAALCNRSLLSSQRAVAFIGQGQPVTTIAELPDDADITLITTADHAIVSCCEALARHKRLKLNSIVLHCCASLPSSILNAATSQGALVASVHPMYSFSRPEQDSQHYAGTYCALEGDRAALPTIRQLFEAIGSIVYDITVKHKALYHAAGVFASNYLVTLYDTALNCLKQSGVDDEVAPAVIAQLMRTTLHHIEQAPSPHAALSGPIKRGDVETIGTHLDALSQHEHAQAIPQQHASLLYQALARATLALVADASPQHDQLRERLGTER